MIVVNAKQEELQLVTRLSSSAILNSIRLVSVLAEGSKTEEVFTAPREESEMELSITHTAELRELVEAKYMSAAIGAEAILRAKKGDQVPLARIKVEYLLKYILPPVPVPKDMPREVFALYAKYNALINAWPYIRATVNDLSSGLGFPVLLPLVRVAPEAKPVQNDVVAPN